MRKFSEKNLVKPHSIMAKMTALWQKTDHFLLNTTTQFPIGPIYMKFV